MLGKLKALSYLLKEARGFRGKFALLRHLLFGQMFGSPRETVAVRFKHFHLSFHTRQGELTPYREIAQVIPSVIPDATVLHDWTIVDAGANIGLFSLFLRKARLIVAVEPNPDVCNVLRMNFEENEVRGKVVQKAISERTGTVRMTFQPDASVLSTISESGEAEVEATSIDDLIRAEQLSRVDLLKLDLEGHELPALRGCAESFRKSLIERVYVEYYGDERLSALDAILAAAGFSRTATFDFNALYALDRSSRKPAN